MYATARTGTPRSVPSLHQTSAQVQDTLLEVILVWIPPGSHTEVLYMEPGGICEALETGHVN